jgi:NADH:ubiquinone oxidoreductase subunit 3 (subunit A)
MSMEFLLTPPVAFFAYIPIILLIVGLGRLLAGRTVVTPGKTSVYGSGEASPTFAAAPGYQPFFLIALFFAVVHLAMLVLGIGTLPIPAAVYLGGLFVALVALILG